MAIWLSGRVSEASRFASPSGANRDGSPTLPAAFVILALGCALKVAPESAGVDG